MHSGSCYLLGDDIVSHTFVAEAECGILCDGLLSMLGCCDLSCVSVMDRR